MAKFMVSYEVPQNLIFESTEQAINLIDDLEAILVEQAGRKVTSSTIICHFFAPDKSIPTSDQFETYLLNCLIELEDNEVNFKYTANDLNQISMAIVRIDKSDSECLLNPFSK